MSTIPEDERQRALALAEQFNSTGIVDVEGFADEDVVKRAMAFYAAHLLIDLDRCCSIHETHVSPHRGCILR